MPGAGCAPRPLRRLVRSESRSTASGAALSGATSAGVASIPLGDLSRKGGKANIKPLVFQLLMTSAEPPGLVADGRDMGTVVFPEADLKIFLTASAEERAHRRYKQLKDKGSDVSLPALSREIAERDARDSTRAVAPLKPAPDAA